VGLLNKMKLGESAKVLGFDDNPKKEGPVFRLIELGIELGSVITLCYKTPFGGYPLAVKVRDRLIGLGKEESSLIFVSKET
jgi:Fe2+ transport system protein FeoA